MAAVGDNEILFVLKHRVRKQLRGTNILITQLWKVAFDFEHRRFYWERPAIAPPIALGTR